jgi:hypothetical protein
VSESKSSIFNEESLLPGAPSFRGGGIGNQITFGKNLIKRTMTDLEKIHCLPLPGLPGIDEDEENRSVVSVAPNPSEVNQLAQKIFRIQVPTLRAIP